MGSVEFRWFLDCRLVQYREFVVTLMVELCTHVDLEYLDDLVFNGYQRSLVVAIMAVRLDRLHNFWFIHLYDRKDRSYLSHFVSRRW